MHKLWLAMAAASTGTAAIPAKAAAAPVVSVPVSDVHALGVTVSRNGTAGSAVAGLGLWNDEGALELGGFRDGPAHDVDPALVRTAELVAGKAMRSRGVRLGASFYRGGREARGWSLGVEARRQKMSDIGAALSGSWRTAGDSRLSVSGKLKF